MSTSRGAFQRKGERKRKAMKLKADQAVQPQPRCLGGEASPGGWTEFELLGKFSDGTNGEKTLSLLTAWFSRGQGGHGAQVISKPEDLDKSSIYVLYILHIH